VDFEIGNPEKLENTFLNLVIVAATEEIVAVICEHIKIIVMFDQMVNS
jgi:hypothetical protein